MIKSAYLQYDMEKLIKLLQQQIACQECRHGEQIIELQRRHKDQTKLVQEMVANRPQNLEARVATTTQLVATPNFTAFDSFELWKDVWSRFCTFTNAHSVPNVKKPKDFLATQTSSVYKMLSHLAA